MNEAGPSGSLRVAPSLDLVPLNTKEASGQLGVGDTGGSGERT